MKFIDSLVYSIARKLHGNNGYHEDKEWTDLKRDIEKLKQEREYLEKADRMVNENHMSYL